MQDGDLSIGDLARRTGLTVTAINQRNYTVVQGAVLVIATLFIIVNLVTDLLYGWLDPRIDAGGER